jgi:hypothetical protein
VCRDADREHARTKRQYAHVFHVPGTVCVAEAFERLPEWNRLGILMHEYGHFLAGPERTEEQADEIVKQRTGIDIRYHNGLQRLDRRDMVKARRILAKELF